jgi:chemotaxis protein histidine kinase CheA
MSGDTDEEFLARMADLNELFASTLPPSFDRIMQARAAFDARAPQPALAREMESVLHTLAGAAGTFGFAVLGQRARLLERRLCELAALEQADGPGWDAWLVALDTFVAWGRSDPKGPYPQAEPAT